MVQQEGYRVAHSVYDEIVMSVPEKYAEDATVALEQIMAEPVAWWPELPLAADAGFATNYLNAKP
jgi:DNA polymerase I-like protein with 3'-5' exonuclease and polymerase domains